jgi:hypothetical protein
MRFARKLQATIARSIPANGPIQYIHQPCHCPEMTDGPRLRAGFVLVPDMGASAHTMIA